MTKVSRIICTAIALWVFIAPVAVFSAETTKPAAGASTAELKAADLRAKADLLFKNGDTSAASDLLKQALLITPESTALLSRYACSLIAMGQEAQAVEPLTKATRLQPNQSAHWELLGQCYLTLGLTREGIAALRKSLLLCQASGTPCTAELKRVLAAAEYELQDKQANSQCFRAEDYLYQTVRHGAARWPASSMPLKVYIAPAELVPSFRPVFAVLLKQAFSDWSAASCGRISFAETVNPGDANIICRWADGTPSGALATEGADIRYKAEAGYLKTVEITFFTRMANGSPVSDNHIARIALHQTGHALGLQEHSYNPNDVLFFRGRNAPYVLTERDKNTLIGLYSMDLARLMKQPAVQARSSSAAATLPPRTEEQRTVTVSISEPQSSAIAAATARSTTISGGLQAGPAPQTNSINSAPQMVAAAHPHQSEAPDKPHPGTNPIRSSSRIESPQEHAHPPEHHAATQPVPKRPSGPAALIISSAQKPLPQTDSTRQAAPLVARFEKPADISHRADPPGGAKEADELARLGQSAMDELQFDLAVQKFEAAMQLDACAEKRQLFQDACQKAANFHWSSGHFEQADRLFKKAGSTAGHEYAEFCTTYACELARQGCKEMQAERFSTAAEKFKKSTSLNDKAPDVLFNYAMCLVHCEDFQGAIAALKRAVSIKPDYAKAWGLLGSCHLKLNEKQQALVAYRTSLQIDPAAPNAVSYKQQIKQLESLSKENKPTM